MADSALTPSKFLLLCLACLAIAIGLGETYSWAHGRFGLVPWRAALAAHGILALILLVIRKPARVALSLHGLSAVSFLPGLLIGLGAFTLAKSGGQSNQEFHISGHSELIYIISTLTVIPLLEEIVFRTGISPFLGRFADGWWSIWFGALVFSLAHSNPSFGRVVSLQAGLPLGPFLLGICCDLIVRRWGRVWPAVFFHASCNATVYIFSSLNPSWLAKLGQLYM